MCGVETPEKDVRDETDKHVLLKTNKSTKQQRKKILLVEALQYWNVKLKQEKPATRHFPFRDAITFVGSSILKNEESRFARVKLGVIEML